MGWWSDWIQGKPRWFMRGAIGARSWVYPPSDLFDSSLIEASDWAKKYAPSGDEGAYEPIVNYAESQYNLLVELSDSLDKKADELVRFAVTIAGVVTAAASKTVGLIKVDPAILILLVGGPILASVLCAIRVRTPTSSRTPLAPRVLLEVADLSPHPKAHEIQGVLAASYHVASIGMKTLTSWKAKLLGRATVLFVVGVVLLVIAVRMGDSGGVNLSNGRAS